MGNPCPRQPSSAVNDLENEYPPDMKFSAYGRKLSYTPFLGRMVGSLWDLKTGDYLGACGAVDGGEGFMCDDQRVLVPQVTCEWVN